jgi:23S rRNA U2552 (ribose-2'-O)-methylase RlmE/FtsJ
MIGSKAKARDTITITVDSAEVKPANSFKLLGITFDRQFTVRPYLHSLAREATFRAGRMARLSQHLPRGHLLQQLRSGLLMGKPAHCLPVVARPRLPGSTGTIPEALASVQVAVNDMARSVVGHRREDHISIADLLEAAKYLSLNQQVVRATAMSAWSVYASNNGNGGMRNPVRSWMFGNVNQPATARPMRATTAGEVRVPTRGMDTHVTHGLETWNACAELRGTRSKADANRAAT